MMAAKETNLSAKPQKMIVVQATQETIKRTMPVGGHAQYSLVETNLPFCPSCRSHLCTHGDTFSHA